MQDHTAVNDSKGYTEQHANTWFDTLQQQKSGGTAPGLSPPHFLRICTYKSYEAKCIHLVTTLLRLGEETLCDRRVPVLNDRLI